MIQLPFWKYTACGNDFILLDNRESTFTESHKNIIKSLCHRHLGIGADGLICLEKSVNATLKMRIFNCDGSEAEMCGNGIRCLGHLAKKLGYHEDVLTIETMNRLYPLFWEKDLICVNMGPPHEVLWNQPVEIDGKKQLVHLINTGVPHAILFVDNIETIDIEKWGKFLRHYSSFGLGGANANFAHIDERGNIWLRTYERGVEGETLACGTGATATAIAAFELYKIKNPVNIILRSSDILKITLTPEFKHVTLTGPATFVYQGIIEIPY